MIANTVKPSDYGNDLFDRTKSNLQRIDVHNRAIKNAQKGKKNIWHIRATITALGYFITRAKSAIDKDIPSPSIKIQSKEGSTNVANGVCIVLGLN